MANDKKFEIVVHYPPAAQPFRDREAERSETVGHLKARVLAAFGLAEGTQPDGSVATYTLYDKKTPLEDMTRTLGSLVGEHDHVLQLKLAQQLTQGRV